MNDELKTQNTEYKKIFHKEFVSTNSNPGIAYIENFLKKRINLATNEQIVNAFMNAAQKGSSNKKMLHIMFIRELMQHALNITLKLSKEDRHKIFVEASFADKTNQQQEAIQKEEDDDDF